MNVSVRDDSQPGSLTIRLGFQIPSKKITDQFIKWATILVISQAKPTQYNTDNADTVGGFFHVGMENGLASSSSLFASNR